jgi:hypothetical protein
MKAETAELIDEMFLLGFGEAELAALNDFYELFPDTARNIALYIEEEFEIDSDAERHIDSIEGIEKYPRARQHLRDAVLGLETREYVTDTGYTLTHYRTLVLPVLFILGEKYLASRVKLNCEKEQ